MEKIDEERNSKKRRECYWNSLLYGSIDIWHYI
jgi:hypothetical protein